MTQEEETELDFDKLNYVFDGIIVEYIHKPKFSILVRPYMKDEISYIKNIMKRIPASTLNDIKILF